MDIGVYASAMEVFDRLGLWNPLIVCCQRAGRTGKVSHSPIHFSSCATQPRSRIFVASTNG